MISSCSLYRVSKYECVHSVFVGAGEHDGTTVVNEHLLHLDPHLLLTHELVDLVELLPFHLAEPFDICIGDQDAGANDLVKLHGEGDVQRLVIEIHAIDNGLFIVLYSPGSSSN